MKIGLLGGVFDPIHIGHLNCANQAADIFGLDRVYFLPTAVPPHKKQRGASADDRWNMVQLAIAGHPLFEASRFEMDHAGTSYTIDTVRWFKKNRAGELYFILGLDAFGDIHQWKAARALLQSCNFIVVSRPGGEPGEAAARLAEKFRALGLPLKRLKGGDARVALLRAEGSPYRIAVCRIPEMDVSSTAVREKVKAGQSVKYLVPEAVEHYIDKMEIYK